MEDLTEKYDFPAETGKSFKLAPGAPPVSYSRKHGHVDIRTLTPDKAAALVAAKHPHILAKDESAAKAVPLVKA